MIPIDDAVLLCQSLEFEQKKLLVSSKVNLCNIKSYICYFVSSIIKYVLILNERQLGTSFTKSHVLFRFFRTFKVNLPNYKEMVERRNRIIPKFKVTQDTFQLELEDCITTSVSSIISFLEENDPAVLNVIEKDTELCLTAKVKI